MNETPQITSTLDSLSDEQLNTKFAKLMHWKLVDGKWWHDDIGDGPPSNYCKTLGRSLAQEIVTRLLARTSVGRGMKSSTASVIQNPSVSSDKGSAPATLN